MTAAVDQIISEAKLPSWQKAAATLLRQQLEATLDTVWAAEVGDPSDVSWKTKFLCLPFLTDKQTGAQAWETWSELTTACHYRPCTGEVSADQLKTWQTQVVTFEAVTREAEN